MEGQWLILVLDCLPLLVNLLECLWLMDLFDQTLLSLGDLVHLSQGFLLLLGFLHKGSEVCSIVAVVTFSATGRSASLGMGVSAVGALGVGSYSILMDR